MNLQQKYAAALVARGERLVKRTFRYEVYTWSRKGPGYYFYLGAAGAVRVGHTIAASKPVSQSFKDELLTTIPAAAEKALQELLD